MSKRIKDKEAIIALAASGEAQGCVIWPYAKTHNGYAHTSWGGKQAQRLSRVVCEMAHGPAPKDKPLALHTCGNRACINANHLYWGDYYDNFADRDRDGTTARGEKIACAKLKADEICQIQSAYESGCYSQADIAEAYGVSQGTIQKVLNGKTWQHVECEADNG